MERGYFDYETKATLCLTNDTREAVTGTIRWALRNSDADVISSGEFKATVDAFSVNCFEEMDFKKTDVHNNYFSYEFESDGKILSEGTVLFTVPKHFEFKDPSLRCEINGNKITVYSQGYARSVEIYSPDSDFILSDNFFDMNGGSKTVDILEGIPKTIAVRSVYDIK